MYPFLRLAHQLARARGLPPLGLRDVHVSHHRCWPWDLDGFMEMNNGRTLTLYDLGRFGAGVRMGLSGVLREKRWGLAVAGTSVRYRKRVTAFQKIEMRTRVVGWDARFVYIVQDMWVAGTCCSQALLRTAVVAGGRAVPTTEVLTAMGEDAAPPALPDWVAAWIEAEATRPWPPERPAAA
ncbi:acyl-CoA thioesterase [Jannaschia sp. KMU-145]|uniref:acyl-CoA thioesterase n=1 Tax=Jannaschia halovivens TaxID=3388667 RepID=UPI00396B0273